MIYEIVGMFYIFFLFQSDEEKDFYEQKCVYYSYANVRSQPKTAADK
jgi:hypothetical protein